MDARVSFSGGSSVTPYSSIEVEEVSAETLAYLLIKKRHTIKSFRIIPPEVGDEAAPFGVLVVEYSSPRLRHVPDVENDVDVESV